MEKERQVLVDRIEKIKSKTTSQAHLLKIAQELRIEKDRDHELILQRMQENKAIESLQVFKLDINFLFILSFINY